MNNAVATAGASIYALDWQTPRVSVSRSAVARRSFEAAPSPPQIWRFWPERQKIGDLFVQRTTTRKNEEIRLNPPEKSARRNTCLLEGLLGHAERCGPLYTNTDECAACAVP